LGVVFIVFAYKVSLETYEALSSSGIEPRIEVVEKKQREILINFAHNLLLN
jgi:hypothetical protein